MEDNIFSKLFNAPDPGRDFISEYNFRKKNYRYFLEMVLIWSFDLYNRNKLDNFIKQVLFKLTFYFESDFNDIYIKFLEKFNDINNPLFMCSLDSIESFILKHNHDVLQYIANKCDKYQLELAPEIAKLIILNTDFLCSYFIHLCLIDQKLYKDIGLFNPKIGIFKRQTPEEYLEKINKKNEQRSLVYKKYIENGLSPEEAEDNLEKKYPLATTLERIFWDKNYAVPF